MNENPVHLQPDNELIKTIYRSVEEKLIINRKGLSRFIWLTFMICLICLILIYCALFIAGDPGLFVLCFITYGFVSLLFAFNTAHEFSHDNIFKNKKLNNFCYTAIFTLIGAHAESWKNKHINTHHFAPNVEGLDPDIKMTKLIRVLPNSKHYWFNTFQHLYTPFLYTVYSLIWVFFKDTVILYRHEKHIDRKGFVYHLSFWLQKAVYITLLLVLPILFSGQSWQMVVTAFLMMHLCMSSVLIFVIVMSHHVDGADYPDRDSSGNIATSWHMNQIKSSNDFYPFSKTANFLFGGFNNHITHHLFPNVHHYYYPGINVILYDILLKNGIKPNETTFMGGVVSHLRLLKRMSAKNKAL